MALREVPTRPAGDALPVATLAHDKGAVGPVTAARHRRTLAGYAVLFVTGLVVDRLGGLPALGLSLMWPGGGLLHHAAGDAGMVVGHLLAFVGVQACFALGLVAWVVTGNVLAPLAVWIGAAGWAASMHHGAAGTLDRGGVASTALPWAIVATGVALWLRAARRRPELLRKRDEVNRYLVGVTTATTPLDERGLPPTRELSADELALGRFVLDRALQPVDEFNGFDKLDQFREAATRYQIFHLSAALSGMAHVATPSMRAYQEEAQHRLMQKMLYHHVWSYWRLENFWGNFSLDPNPLPHDNVMYTGWYAAVLGLVVSGTGTTRYDAPGSLTLLDGSGKAAYGTSFPELCATIRSNFERSDFTLYACEPKFVYPICPGFGAVALTIHDRVYGTDLWSSIAQRYRKSLEDEFIRPDGRITAIRCYRTGVTVPGFTAIMADAAAASFMNGYFPDIARRSWEVVRHDLIRLDQGGPRLETALWDQIDFGNYKRVHAACFGLVANAAREMGDDEVADRLLAHVEATVPNEVVGGVRHYRNVSLGGHASLLMARINRTNGLHDAIAVGKPTAWQRGPMLLEASYPEVLVAKALSDGDALSLVLRPGTERRDVRVLLGQLRPHGRYRVVGAVHAELAADAAGQAPLDLLLADRAELHVTPIA